MLPDSASIVGNIELSQLLSEGSYPLSSEDLIEIRTLSTESAQRLWQPDTLRFALSKITRFTGVSAELAVRKAVEDSQQTSNLPYTFLRRLDQLRPDLYSYQSVQDCTTQISINVFEALGVPRKKWATQNAIWHKKRFLQIQNWFLTLPVQHTEKVYFARQPEKTLMLPWSLFANHWDSFYEPFSCVNVVNDDPDWFLFIHPEEIAIWGCTSKYATANNLDPRCFLKPPIDYSQIVGDIVSRRREEMQQFVGTYTKC